MNALVLIPTRTGLRYARVIHRDARSTATQTALVSDISGTLGTVGDLQAVLTTKRGRRPVDVLSVRALYGGRDFPAPVLLDEQSRARLLSLAARAPLCVASTMSILDQIGQTFPHTPVALAFETSFFVDLPVRETTYALPSEVGRGLRRWGYHGLYHEAATAWFARQLPPAERPARVLSICLDARPEVAAVLGRMPLMVTGGSTPLEGLPGELNCGEIDPSIALALAADPSIGPERANMILTRESGFFGMLGRPATLSAVLNERRARVAQVREHLLYHVALAAGSGLAALAGLDGVVFSGRYAEHGDKVAAYLVPKLERALDVPVGTLPWSIHAQPLESIVAEAGIAALLAGRERPMA
jgi:acetate kinase